MKRIHPFSKYISERYSKYTDRDSILYSLVSIAMGNMKLQKSWQNSVSAPKLA